MKRIHSRILIFCLLKVLHQESGPIGPEPGMEDASDCEPSDLGDLGDAGPVPEAPHPSDAPQSVPSGGEAQESGGFHFHFRAEVSRASPAYQRMLEKLRSNVELDKLHVKHYHMSPAQFRRRTSMFGLLGEVYNRYDRIVKSCKICSLLRRKPELQVSVPPLLAI